MNKLFLALLFVGLAFPALAVDAPFVAIVGWDGSNRLAKYQPFPTLPEAQAHALKHGGFAIATPAGNKKNWLIDPVAKTISISASPILTSRLRGRQRTRLIREAVARIKAHVPDWDSIDKIKTVAGMWPSLQAGASVQMIAAKDVYLFVKNTALPKLNAMTDQAAIRAVDPTNADPFGDGTLWP